MLINTKYKKLCMLLFTFILYSFQLDYAGGLFPLFSTNCSNSNCPHIYELQNGFKVNVGKLPKILYLREGLCISEAIIDKAQKEIAFPSLYIAIT